MVEDNIKNIAIGHKQRFTVDGDMNRIISLDTSDMNIIVRLEETYPKMWAKAKEAVERMAATDIKGSDSSALSDLAKVLKSVDAQMREELDYVFDSGVSDICVPKGNMYDPIDDGGFRFEHVIEVLTTLYADSLSANFKKMRDKVNKRTAKYNKRKN